MKFRLASGYKHNSCFCTYAPQEHDGLCGECGMAKTVKCVRAVPDGLRDFEWTWTGLCAECLIPYQELVGLYEVTGVDL